MSRTARPDAGIRSAAERALRRLLHIDTTAALLPPRLAAFHDRSDADEQLGHVRDRKRVRQCAGSTARGSHTSIGAAAGCGWQQSPGESLEHGSQAEQQSRAQQGFRHFRIVFPKNGNAEGVALNQARPCQRTRRPLRPGRQVDREEEDGSSRPE